MKRKNMTVSARTTRRALGMNILSLLLCVSMLIGTTFAWFTDSVTSGRNQIIAGNLDVEVYHQSASVTTPTSIDAQTNLFQDNDGKDMLWEPGAMSYETFTVKNVGDMAFKYNLAMNILDYNAVSTDTGKTLKDVLKVLVLTGDDIIAAPTRELVAAKFAAATETKTIADFNKDGGVLFGKDSGKTIEEKFQVLVYWAPTDNDNTYNINNGKTTTDGERLFITFGVNVIASQYTEESDSFDNQYDVGIILPDLPVSIDKTFESAAIKNKVISSETVVVKNVSTGDGVAEMPKAAVEAVVDALTSQAADKKADTDVETVIYLKVETAEKTESAVTYNINLSAIMSYTDTNDQPKTTELTNLDNKMAGQIVTATMNIGKGLSNVLVKHNTVAMTELASATADAEGFYYNKADGVLTIKSKSFSPFQVSYDFDAEVCIGDTLYETLAEAVNAADANAEINVLKNITLASRVDVAKSMTINLNGKTIGSTATCANGSVFDVKNGATVTVKNGSLVGIAGPTGLPNPYTNECDVIVVRSGGVVNVENVSISIDCRTGCCVYAFDGGTANIKSGTYTNLAEAFDENGKTKAMLLNQADVATQLIFVTGGTFKGENPANGDNSGLVKSFVSDGYRVEEASGAYTVEYGFAAIGENCYASLADAIAAAKTGDTIKMLADTEYNNVGFTLTGINLDLNGKKIKVTRLEGGPKSFQLNGNVTISNGSIEASLYKNSMCAIYGNQESNVTLNNVNVKAYRTSDNAVAYAVAPFGGYMSTPNGNMVINGGVFDGGVATNGSTRGGSLTINSGTFNEDLYLPAYMTYTINGGTFKKSVEFRSGVITINGGTFENTGTPEYTGKAQDPTIAGCSIALLAYNGPLVNSGDSGYGPTPDLTITGGTFAGKIGLYRVDASYAYPTVTKPEGSTIETVELGINAPASGSVTIAKTDVEALSDGSAVSTQFTVGDQVFVFSVAKSSSLPFSDNATEMKITVTEAESTNTEAWKFTFANNVTKYYTISFEGLKTTGDAGWPNLFVKDATNASYSGTQLDWNGCGYSSSISGFEGTFFMACGIHYFTATA